LRRFAAGGTIATMIPGAAVVYSPDYECDIGVHVFPVVKFRLLRDRLLADGDVAEAEILAPEPASREELLRVHTAEYLDDLEQLRWTPRTLWSELPLERDVVRAYALAAGGTLLAAREARERGMGVNLGGGFHHAFPDRAEGFCYLNDLAVAIRGLQAERRVRRAAVVDCDVHQGNGTAHVFRDDPDVFTLSLHQERNYPVPKERSDLDIGFENGTGDAEYLAALRGALERVWEARPEIVLYQAGADPYAADRLGGLALSFEGLEERDRLVLEGAAEHGIPAVVTLGGGYAQRVEDTVDIHLRTCRLALRLARDRAGRSR
jgi:acetoin utilization deacetylase AcuC-like enzyme